MDTFEPSTNGSAIQRGNIYTYITDNYKLSTNQSYHPGTCGDQNTLSIATLPNGLTVYTTNPFRDECDMTPGYWAGFGVAPDSAQDKNVIMSIYDIPDGRILMAPQDISQYTHTLFPEELFDECSVEGKYAFGRKGDTYIALIGSSDLYYKPYDQAQVDSLELNLTDTSKRFDLAQDGSEQFWIYELSSTSEEGNFEDFKARIKANSITFEDMTLSYVSDGVTRLLAYNGDFTVDGTIVDLNYDRFESPYITAERKSSTFSFDYAGHTLTLDFDNHTRTKS
jgi:hypothetical protein